MLQLFISSSSLLRRPLWIDDRSVDLSSEAIECARDYGVTDGLPFFLDDRAHYHETLNAFLRSCPTMGVRSVNSLKAYALDISIWERFLAERRGGKSLWRADRDDLAAFHAARRRSAAAFRISASTWNRSVASLQKLYDWAVEGGLMSLSPFGRQVTFRSVRGTARWAPVRSVRAREPAARRGNLRFVDLEQYILFRDVGLRGLCVDGDEDSESCGRHGERNALFAEILVTTGLRLQEAASLLVVEVPRVEQKDKGLKQRSTPLHIGAGTAKGNKSREIRLSYRLIRRLTEYIDLERESVAHRHPSARAMDFDDGRVLVAHERGRIRLAGAGASRWIALDGLSSLERRRLVLNDRGGPSASLWLNERGKPMTSAAWEAVFRRASTRCRALGINLDVSPHTLRHVFATNMLAMLIREQIGQIVHRQPGEASGASAYRRMIGDPLQTLQTLLGHASIASTHIYLGTLDESRALIEAAADRWTSMVADKPIST